MSLITDTLRAARIAAKVKQKDLAEKLGFTQAFLSDIERARRELPEQHYEKLPEPIRAAVLKAAKTEAKRELRDRMRRIVQIGKAPASEKPQKT